MSINLNKRITIRKSVKTVDEEGYTNEVWHDIATVWASIKNLHGTEFFQAQAINSKATCKMTIRHMKDLDTGMKIIYNGKEYNILYLDDINECHRFIEIMCEVVQ